MKITFEEVLSEKEWLHKELMVSLTPDIITKASDDGFYDVKLVINGVELEPKFFNDIMNGVEHYIDNEAEKLGNEKFEEATEKLNKLNYLIHEATEKIRDEFDIKGDE